MTDTLDRIREAGAKAAREVRGRADWPLITTGDCGFREMNDDEILAWLAGYDEAKEGGK